MNRILYLATFIALWDGIKTTRSDEEWRETLGRDRYCVMRKKATEPAYSGTYLYPRGFGIYSCAACSLPLFSSLSQNELHHGWPSFQEPVKQIHVWIKEDYSLSFKRYEVLCRGCDGHLGHVFRNKDLSLRYTVNSLSIIFNEL